MFLSKTLYPLLSTGSHLEDLSQHDRKNVDWAVKNQNKTKFTEDIVFEKTRQIRKLSMLQKMLACVHA